MNACKPTLDFEAYLFENRISPPPAYSERIDFTCARIRRDSRTTRIARPLKRKRRLRLRRALRWLAPVAVFLIVLVTLLSIPSVSQAMRSWFGDLFRLTDYMAATPDERENNADIAGAVQTPAPAQTSFSIQFLDETEYYAGVDEWRLANGFPVFNRADYAWVSELNPEVSEILYDGRNLIVNTRIPASPTRFLGTYGGEGERYDLWTSGVSVTVNGEPYTDFADQGGGLVLQPFFKKDGTQGYDRDAVNAADGILEQTTLIGNASPAFPSGPVTVTIEMWLMDGTIDDLGTVGLVAILTQTLTFDATEGNGMLSAGYDVTQRLAGTAPLTFSDGGSLKNVQFDYSAVTVNAKVERRKTGVSVTIHYSFDSEEEKDRLWDALILGTVGHNGIQYEAVVGGESIGKVWHGSDYLGSRDDPVLEIPLTESELAGVESIVLRPIVCYLSAYKTGDADYVELPFGEAITLKQYSARYTDVPLEGCDIVIPLNGT